MTLKAGFAPVNRNTNRLGDPFVREQFEQQMKEVNYKKKTSKGRWKGTVFDKGRSRNGKIKYS